MNIKLPGNMAVGLILPLLLIALDNDMEDWLGNWPPLAHLLEEVNWAEFFRQTGLQLTHETLGEKLFLRDLQQNKLDLSEILDALPLSPLGLDGIIVRLDVAGFEPDEDFPYFKWRDFYGYCKDFKDVEGVIQSLIEKASQEVAA
jgi:hypothetical protein